jgi:TonB family protein
MMIYLLKSALLLALLYGGFALLLSRETFHRFNRLALLVVMIASLALPAMQLTMDKPSFFTISSLTPNPIEEGNSLTPNPSPRGEGSNMDEGSSLITENEQIIPFESDNKAESEKALPQRGSWEGALYLAGLFASFGFFLFQLFRFWRDTKGGTSTKDEEGNTIVIRGGEFSPYSFLHYIIISVSDYERLRKPILAHEQAHIRLGHSWDLLLLEVVKAIQWFNPFVYPLGRDLKAVHEYEADNAVLNQGIDAKTYQLLLVTKAVGNRLQTLGNNLSHHSLKKRIKMMHKTNSNRWMMTKAVVLPALMALAVVAFAKPKVEEIPATENENILPADDKIADKSEDALVKLLDDGKTFIVNIPDGTLIENRAKGMNVIKVENNKTFIILPVNNTLVLLDNKPADIKSLTKKSRSILKKAELSRDLNNYELVLTTTPVQITTSVKDDKIYDVVEVNAQFPGGDAACMKWIKDHIKYPEECIEKEIQGRVQISFVVEKDGSIADAKVLRPIHPLLSEEALRVVKAMPKWAPAKVKGQTVRSRFNLPVSFRLSTHVVTVEGTPSGPYSDNDSIYGVVDELASFPGGEAAYMKWLSDHIKYPEECKAQSIQGRVMIQFVVNKDGSIPEIKVLKSPHSLLSEEAVRVVKAMPKWKPAKAEGEIVRSRFILPIMFRLPPAQTEQKPKE